MYAGPTARQGKLWQRQCEAWQGEAWQGVAWRGQQGHLVTVELALHGRDVDDESAPTTRRAARRVRRRLLRLRRQLRLLRLRRLRLRRLLLRCRRRHRSRRGEQRLEPRVEEEGRERVNGEDLYELRRRDFM